MSFTREQWAALKEYIAAVAYEEAAKQQGDYESNYVRDPERKVESLLFPEEPT
jgi:hypothetical protein